MMMVSECDKPIRIPPSLPSCYPAVPPVFEIEANKSGTFTFSDADHLYQLLEEASLARIGSTAIFDLVSLAQEELAELVFAQRSGEECTSGRSWAK